MKRELVVFTARTRPELFRDYLSIKFDVFSRELGWKLRNRGEFEAAAEAQDYASEFVSAIEGGRTIGTVRLIGGVRQIPRQDLFEAHRLAFESRGRIPRLGTLNGLAIVPDRRGSRWGSVTSKPQNTIAQSIVHRAIQRIAELRTDLILITAIQGRSMSLFAKCGFLLVDYPVAPRDAPQPCGNMCLLLPRLPDPLNHAKARAKRSEKAAIEWSRQIYAYLREREQSILRGSSIRDLAHG